MNMTITHGTVVGLVLVLVAFGLTYLAARRSTQLGVLAVQVTSILWAFAGVNGPLLLYVLGLAAPLCAFVLSGRKLGPGDLTTNSHSAQVVPDTSAADWMTTNSASAMEYSEMADAPSIPFAMVNPGSGLPMANSSFDVAGNAFGSGSQI